MELGEKIKFHREKLHMTLEELGNKVGVGKSTVRKWENGMIVNMRRDKISKIASALNVSPGYLMGWTDIPDRNVVDLTGVIEAVTNSAMNAIERGEIPSYYDDDETAEIAQELYENEDMRLLFDAAKDSRPEDLKMAADLLKRLKATNTEG